MDLEIFTVIGLIISLIALAIVFWDHFKDDRLLTKRVQEFYDDIENYILTYYKYTIVVHLLKDTKNTGFSEDVLEKKNFEYKREKLTYQGAIYQKFDEYSKYLGIYRKPDENNYVINKTDIYLLIIHGALMKDISNIKVGKQYTNIVKDFLNIKQNEIDQIKSYLKELRDYWKVKYSKKLFRRKLKPKVDFSKLKAPDKFI